jgi:hypothetical protein
VPHMTMQKLSAEEQRARREDRVAAICLRMAIGYELDRRGIINPAEIGEALGMLAAEAHGAAEPAPVARGRRGAASGGCVTARSVCLTAGTTFGRCTRCNAPCGLMAMSEARAGGEVGSSQPPARSSL